MIRGEQLLASLWKWPFVSGLRGIVPRSTDLACSDWLAMDDVTILILELDVT